MARELHTMVEISASPDQVWQVLTDFDAWPDWNVADPGFVGEMHEGAEVELTSTSPSGKRSQVRITLISVEPNRQLSWESSLPLLFKARHTYRIEAQDGNCTFYNEAGFWGILAHFISKQLPTEEMFKETNLRFKERVESGCNRSVVRESR
ncbi:MAG: SRPBCC domain-containing protein [Candidatus Tectomicrobia bacterium]